MTMGVTVWPHVKLQVQYKNRRIYDKHNERKSIKAVG